MEHRTDGSGGPACGAWYVKEVFRDAPTPTNTPTAIIADKQPYIAAGRQK